MGSRTTFINLPQTLSTNAALRETLAANPDLPSGTVVYTHCQTAGRGQRGNSWEAEPGMNVTMSMLLRPGALEAREQFAVSECVALGVARVLDGYLPDGMAVEVKWPNDVYVGDKKICGILIENSLSGNRVDYSIAGIGINVNQLVFRSSAPNPVSIAQLTGHVCDVETVMREVADEIICLLDWDRGSLHDLYCRSLWRCEGMHPYMTPDGDCFFASILSVAPDGYLTLLTASGDTRRFAFKEIAAIL